MMYKKVWAPDGTMWEVPPERASLLVLNEGWSNTPPKVTTKKSKKDSKDAFGTTSSDADTTEDSSDDGQVTAAHYASKE